jgi:hypothetical protein
VAQFVLDDGQEVDPIEGPRIDCLQLPGARQGGILFVGGWRRIDEPAVAGGVKVEIDLVVFDLAEAAAVQVVDEELDLGQPGNGSGVQTGGRPAGDRFGDDRLEIGLGEVGRRITSSALGSGLEV